MGYIGKYVAHALKIPAVHTYHTMYEDYLHYIMNGHLLRPSGVKQLSRAFLYHMTGLICPSQRVMDTMIRYGIKIPMRIIPTGVDLTQYSKPSEVDLRKEYNVPKDAKVILSVSRVAYEKNIDFLLRSFAKLTENIDNVYLFIVGDGPAIDDLRSLARELKIEHRVIFTGYVLHEKVVTYYQQADLFASASNTEAQGLTFIESLAARTQVLSWDNDYDRKLIHDPSLGAVFSTEQELVTLMSKYLTEAIPIEQSVLEPVLDRISAKHFGNQVLEFYSDLTDHFECEKQEELDEEEASLMRRVRHYLKLTRNQDEEELTQYRIGYDGAGKYRSLILSTFSRQNYSIYAMPSEDKVQDPKKVITVADEDQLLNNTDLVFIEADTQESFFVFARKARKNQIVVNLSEIKDFDFKKMQEENKEIDCYLFDAPMVINDFDSATLLVGGSQEKYEEISPIFDVFTDEVLYTGDLGAGQIGINSLNVLRSYIKNGVEEAIDNPILTR